MSEHYINNLEFLEALREYRKKLYEAKELGIEKPPIPNYIGECILKIATRITQSSNFIGSKNRSVYFTRATFNTHRDEMIGDAVENCLRYIHNFDPEKSSNPFAYFTQIIVHAFIRHIHKEKRQLLIKNKIIMDVDLDMFDTQEHDSDDIYVNSYLKFLQENVIHDEVKPEIKVKPKKKTANLDDILELE